MRLKALIKLKQRLTHKFLMVAIVFILLITSLATLVYYLMSSYASYAQQLHLYKKNCQSISSFLNMSLEEVNAVFNLFSVDRDIYDWLQSSYFNPTIDYYNLSKIQKRFMDILSSNEKITSFYLHSQGNNLILSTDYMLHSLESFPKSKVFEAFYGQRETKIWINLPAETGPKSYPGRTLSFVGQIPVNLKMGTLSININEKKLLQELYNNNLCKDSEGVLIVGGSGQMIACNNEKFIPVFDAYKKQILSAHLNEVYSKRLDYHNEKYFTFVWSNNNGNYKTVYMVPYAEIRKGLDSGNASMLFLIFLSSVTALVLLYIFRRSYSKPLEFYNESLKANLEDLKDNFILHTLTGSLRDNEIISRAQALKLDFTGKGFIVVIFQINNYYNYLTGLKEEDRHVMNRRIFNAIQSMFTIGHTSYVVNTELGNFTILLSADEGRFLMENIENTLRYMQNELMENCGLSACAAVSDLCCALKDINACYIRALRLLQYKLVYGKNSIIYSSDISPKVATIEKYPVDALNKIIEYVKLGDMEKVEKSIDTICSEVLSNNDLPVDIINTVLSNILYSIIKLTLEFRYQVSDVFPEDVFLKLYGYEFLQDKKTYVLGVCRDLTAYRHSKENNAGKKTVQIILSYIHEMYDKPISLNLIADHMGMNASYLSALIKDELGIYFVDLLNDLRLKKSLNLLKEGKLSIKQIAEECGYENPHSYIRNFKKVYLVTPAEFKNKLSASGRQTPT